MSKKNDPGKYLESNCFRNHLNKEYEELGLDVSGDELYDFLLGSNMNPAVSQLFADPNTGQVDKERPV